MFWVPGAAAGIYGIRNAGLAVAVGTWSSIIVLTSFVFGFIFFHEEIKDFGQTCMAFVFLLSGLGGMSRFSAHPNASSSSSDGQPQQMAPNGRRASSFTGNGSEHATLSKAQASQQTQQILTPANTGLSPLEMEPLMMMNDPEDDIMNGRILDVDDDKERATKDRIVFWGGRISLTRRQMGILGAVINGAWGGMNLIPLHFAQQDGLSGAGYLISYAGGALIVNTILWILFFGYYYIQKKGNAEEAWECLPGWHVEELWFPGLMAGLLYSLGNFTSILAVTYLGQGTGYSFIQMQLFVSGLWGVFYFREIKGFEVIVKWFGISIRCGDGNHLALLRTRRR